MPFGIVLGYLGYSSDVYPLLQILSHGTRSFLWDWKGLPDFVVKFPNIIELLKTAKKTGKLSEATKYQELDFEKVMKTLGGL